MSIIVRYEHSCKVKNIPQRSLMTDFRNTCKIMFMITMVWTLLPILLEASWIYCSLTPLGSYLGMSVLRSLVPRYAGIPVLALAIISGSRIWRLIWSLNLPWDIVNGSEKFTRIWIPVLDQSISSTSNCKSSFSSCVSSDFNVISKIYFINSEANDAL